MKAKPTPEKELVIIRRAIVNIISFVIHSNDAREFVIKEAPQFGSLHMENNNNLFLIVSPGYDFNEVAEYLESYNED